MILEDILFFGGLGGIAISLLLLIIYIPVFRSARKRLIKRIQEGDED